MGVKRKSSRQMRRRRRYLFRRAGGMCEYCGEKTDLKESGPHEATVDHVVPLSRGGSEEMENLKLACRSCNRAKGAIMLP